ncbi:MAG TPA: hypothetical protein VF582_06105 [Allosphingosinicella sp.]
MTEQTESLIVGILKRIQADVAEIKQDVRDLKVRLGVMVGHVSNLVAAQHHTNERLDRMGDRVERIERRLDLVDVK